MSETITINPKEPIIWEEKNSEQKKKNKFSIENGECDIIGKMSKKSEKKEETDITPKKKSRITNTAGFILRSNDVHKNKYVYTESDYSLSNIKLKIRCKQHGIFYQTPNSHLSGSGCPECCKIETGNRSRFTIDIFLLNAYNIHGNLYNYSKFKYLGNQNKSIIICNIHGEFLQSPNNHISQKHGCPKCGIIKCAGSIRNNTSMFINSAIKMHGNMYGYDAVNYINNSGYLML